MRNLIGYLEITRSNCKSITLLVFSCLLLLSLHSTQVAKAQESTDITTSASIGYTINESNDLIASVVLEINNNSSTPSPVRYFKTSVPFPKTDTLTVKLGDQYLDIQRDPDDTKTNLTIDLQNRILRKDSPFTLIMDIKIRDYFQDGQVIYSLPTAYEFNEISKVNLIMADLFGEPSSIQPSDYDEEEIDGGVIYTFRNIKGQEISILMEKDVTYRFYQKNILKNPDTLDKNMDLILPPTSPSQQLLINDLNPEPDRVEIDAEGNILVQYDVKPETEIEVVISGFVIKSIESAENVSTSDNPLYLQREGYWEITEDGGSIVEKAIGKIPSEPWQSLSDGKRKSLLKGIGSFVVKKLDVPEVSEKSIDIRLGASTLVDGYSEASSSDYVDLTIAILRYYGIPSRQIVGYSTNLQNVFENSTTHTWVQYWDPDSGWKNIDTYQDELQGTNRVEVSDADRIVLMYRGFDPVYPQYTTYNLEAISMEVADGVVNPITQFEASYDEIQWDVRSKYITIPLTIENTGSTIINQLEISDNKGEVLLNSAFPLLPGQSTEFNIELDQLMLLSFRENNQTELPINIKIISTNEEIDSTLYTVPVSFIEEWWWDPFIMMISLFSFVLVVYIIFESYYFAKNGKFSFKKK